MAVNDNRPTTETPVEARQGFLDRPVLVVLATALVLAGIALAVTLGLAPW
jgi:hypothetical protein